MKHYSLFEVGNNQIGTIQCSKHDDLKPLIEVACNAHFDQTCIIHQKNIDSQFHLLK